MPHRKHQQLSKSRIASANAPRRYGPRGWIVAIILAFLIGVVYVPAEKAPFIFDDMIAVVQNDSIVSLWPLVGSTKPGPLNPASEHPTSARPLVNLSFALNYYFGGLNPIGYHWVNFTLHFLNAMLLWALTQRTLKLPCFGTLFARSADWLALVVALLWSLHPLQTEAVIYVTQRTELTMSFFYLATLYCSLRYWTARALLSDETAAGGDEKSVSAQRARQGWLLLAVLACLGGMASKEVMVSAPLIVLLFDRTFVSGTLKSALQRSWPLYLGLACTWVLLAGLMLNGPRADSAGFHLGIPPQVWWFTQSQILFMYLKLAVWPWPLLIHYKLPYLVSFAEAWMYVLPLGLLGVATGVLLWKNRPTGFLGAWFFAILSPTFIIPVATEMAAERRMYLALAPLMLLFVVGGFRWIEAIVQRTRRVLLAWRLPSPGIACGVIVGLLTIAFCLVSTVRLAAYDNEMNLWMEVIRFQPDNPHARLYLASFLETQGNADEAIKQYREAIRIHPNPAEAHYRLGLVLNKKQEYAEAASEFGEALRGLPKKSSAIQNDMATALYMAGRNDQAIEAFRVALVIDPNFWPAHRNLGTALQKAGKFQDAVQSFEAALQLNPKAVDIYNDLANSHLRLNHKAEAVAVLEHGLKLAQASGDTENIRKLTATLQANR